MQPTAEQTPPPRDPAGGRQRPLPTGRAPGLPRELVQPLLGPVPILTREELRARRLWGSRGQPGSPLQQATLIIFDSPIPGLASWPQPSTAPSHLPGMIPPPDPWSSPLQDGATPTPSCAVGAAVGWPVGHIHLGMPTLPNQRESQSCFIVMWSGRASLLNRICTYTQRGCVTGGS